MASKPDGNSETEHLDDAAERVAVLRSGLDLGDHRLARIGVETPDLVLVDAVELIRRRTGRTGGHPRCAHLDDVGDDLDPEVRQQHLGDRTRGDASCGLAGAGSFEDVSSVGEAVLLHAGEIRVAGTHLGERRLRRSGSRAHLLVPLVAAEPLAVLDLDRHGRPERAAVAHTTDQCEFVGLEALAGAAAVSEPAAAHLCLDLLDGDRKSRRETLHHDDERLTVGFARREIPQHQGEAIGRHERVGGAFSPER